MDQDPELWVRQGFFSQMATAIAAKKIMEKDPRVGAVRPEMDLSPHPVDKNGVMGMFAVWTRPYDPIPCPDGMLEADPAIVGRLIGG